MIVALLDGISSARCWRSDANAALLAEYAPWPGAGFECAMNDEMLIRAYSFLLSCLILGLERGDSVSRGRFSPPFEPRKTGPSSDFQAL
jgi:hypothetical protein